MDSRQTRLAEIALESYFATKFFFFSKTLRLELGFGQRASLRDKKLNSKMKRPAPPVQQWLDVGNQAGAPDTAFENSSLTLNLGLHRVDSRQ